MTTKPKSRAIRQLEKVHGGPLSLGAFIASIREGEGWSLAEMAKKLKVTRAHIAAIEHGKPVTPQSAARYAKALGYSEAQFVRLALQDSLHRAHLFYAVEVVAQSG
ncbi:MAG: helix-turn-helix domain-containing protein [Myxococcaceae bacterium]